MGDDSEVMVQQLSNSTNSNQGNNSELRANWNGASVIESESIRFSREPPPPYSRYEIPSVSGTVQLPAPAGPVPPHQTIIVQQQLRHRPVPYTCPTCLKRVVTRVEYVNSRKTHMMAGFICGFTIWCMLCCLAAIPYMASTFKKAVHYCPNCKAYLGSH